MPASYLHGVETIIQNSGPVPVNVVKSAVIGIVGIAPIGATNQLIAVNNVRDAAQFGSEVPGFSIPQALKAILDQGTATILVVNVFDANAHTTQVTAEVKTPTAGKLKLAFAPIGAVTITNNDDSATTLVNNTDYSIDSYGNFQALTANVVNGTALKFSYKKLNAAAVTATVINGSYTSNTGVRTGIEMFDLAKNLFGYYAKILIAPGYSSLTAVATNLITKAGLYRAIALLDAPYGTTVSAAITNRGIAASSNFNTSSKRAMLLYPFLKVFSPAINDNEDRPFSQYMAGVIAATDYNFGYWYSPSNKEINGIVGAERNISAGASDATSDANILNEAGISTIFNTFGTGIRTWGNRSAAYPTVTSPDNFIAVQRTADVIYESLENSVLQYIDLPITKALIDAIRETCNSFLRTLIQRGALMPGSECQFDISKNPPTEVAAGHLTFDLVIMPPVPGERITFNAFIDINLLKNIA
jgi:phage tail sheath protein FI